MKLMGLIRLLLARVLGSRKTTLAGIMLLVFALVLYVLDALHFDRIMDVSVFTACITAGTTLLLAKDV